MRATLRRHRPDPDVVGTVTLRMSVGVHSGDFDFFLVGDPDLHRELLISGPGASLTADMEAAAAAGQIGLSAATAALLAAAAARGRRCLDGRLLRSAPALDDVREPCRASGPAARRRPALLPPPIRDAPARTARANRSTG